MRQAGILFIFFICQKKNKKKKTDEATFLFDQNIMGHLFFVHFKHKNDNLLILASEKNRRGHFLTSLKKTNEGHLKQMEEGLRYN